MMYSSQNSVSANLPRILGAGVGEGGGVYIFSIGHIFPCREKNIYTLLQLNIHFLSIYFLGGRFIRLDLASAVDEMTVRPKILFMC